MQEYLPVARCGVMNTAAGLPAVPRTRDASLRNHLEGVLVRTGREERPGAMDCVYTLYVDTDTCEAVTSALWRSSAEELQATASSVSRLAGPQARAAEDVTGNIRAKNAVEFHRPAKRHGNVGTDLRVHGPHRREVHGQHRDGGDPRRRRHRSRKMLASPRVARTSST